MYAEEIYAELQEDILRDELEYEADDVDDIEESKKEQNTPQKEDTLSEQLFEEEAKVKLQEEMKNSDTPIGIGRFFKISSEGKIDWRNELRAALDRHHKDDYTLLPPSKKLLYTGIYLPSCISKRFQLVVAVDGSGSVDEKLLNEFLSELNFLMNTISNFQIDLLVCDDKIRTHKTFYGGDILEAEAKGGGATDFRPVFEFIERELQDVKLLLYFSDLEGIFPSDAPDYEVKWIAPKETRIPFGDIIVLE
jgi:predicted metal-dependent peptidase